MKLNSSQSIFIVDDDPEDREFLQEAFTHHGGSVQYSLYENGAKLMAQLNSIEENFPGLILLDLNMPGISGKQVLKELKGNENFRHIPIVILTTSHLAADKKMAYDLGANCFLTKPSSHKQLLEMAKAILLLWFGN